MLVNKVKENNNEKLKFNNYTGYLNKQSHL